MKLASVVLRYQHAFEAQYAGAINNTMRAAMQAVIACRTEHYGAMKLCCPQCHSITERYHSCGHRSCPACQQYDSGQWLDRQTRKLLPVNYYMATFTIPRELRSLFWHHQRRMYGLLFDCAVSTLRSFAVNDNALGGEMGMTAVLHTHTRQLAYHPHVHFIVPGGCLLAKRRQWKKHHGRYLFNAFNMATVFRARLLAAIAKSGFTLPTELSKQWVVHCKRVGRGLPALQYLSRYLYRGVISERNIIGDDGQYVRYQYRDSNTDQLVTRRTKGENFLWLVLQHALPKGFRRVRDYGFLHGNAVKTRHLIQLILRVVLPTPVNRPRPSFMCTQCHVAMRVIAFIRPVISPG